MRQSAETYRCCKQKGAILSATCHRPDRGPSLLKVPSLLNLSYLSVPKKLRLNFKEFLLTTVCFLHRCLPLQKMRMAFINLTLL